MGQARNTLAEMSKEAVTEFLGDPWGVVTTPSRALRVLGRERWIQILGFQLHHRVPHRIGSVEMATDLLSSDELGVAALRQVFSNPIRLIDRLLDESVDDE